MNKSEIALRCQSLLKWLGWILAGGFFAVTIQRLIASDGWQEVFETADWSTFLIACSFLFIGLFIRSLSGYVSFKILQYPLSVRESYTYWFLSQLSKYIPGGIWQFAARGVFYHRHGMSLPFATALTVWEVISIVLSGLLIILLAPALIVTTGTVAAAIVCSLVLAVIAGISVHRWPWRILVRLNITKARTMLDTIDEIQRTRYTLLTALFLSSLVGWLLINSGFYFVITAFVDAPSINFFNSFVIFALAWIVGFLVFFTPGGIGSREAVLFAYFTPLIGFNHALSVALISRGWWILMEGLHITIAAIIYAMNKVK